MTSPEVTLVQGPGDVPDGWVAACQQWAGRLAMPFEVRSADDPEGLAAATTDAARSGRAVLLCSGLAADDLHLAAVVTDVGAHAPIVHVAAQPLTGEPGPVPRSCRRMIHGRGRQSCLWALRHLRAEARRPAITVPYGTAPDHVGDLRLPAGDGPHPVAALLHGGFWLDPWERDLMDGLAVDLTDRGWATWNLEYRRLGGSGGGYPATFDDVAAGVAHLDVLARDHPLDPRRVTLVGHSAGGALAVWAATRSAVVTIERVVVLAGILDLPAAARDGLGLGSVATLLGDPDDRASDYAQVSPVALAPIGAPTLLVHGAADDHVPPAHSERYAEIARAGGDEVELVLLDGVDHFTVIDPDSDAWAAAVAHLT
jgi:acetyl esterase/lipase